MITKNKSKIFLTLFFLLVMATTIASASAATVGTLAVSHDSEVAVGKDVTIEATLTLDDATDPSGFDVYFAVGNNGEKTQTDSNGKAYYTYTADTVGDKDVNIYLVPIKYAPFAVISGDLKYDGTLTVKKEAKITIDTSMVDSPTIAGSKFRPIITLTDANGVAIKQAPVTITVNGDDYSATTNNQGKITLPQLTMGLTDMVIKASFGNNEYAFVESEATVKFRKEQSSLTISTTVGGAEVDSAKAFDSVNVKITLKNENDKGIANKNVLVTINGVTGSYTTNNNGVININGLKMSTYAGNDLEISAEFAEDDQYLGSLADKTVTFVKDQPTLTITTTVNGVEVDEAKTGDNVRIQVELLNNNGKAIVGELVTVTINGVDYSGLTNNNGRIVITLKMETGVDLEIKTSFAGSALYLGVTEVEKTVNYRLEDTSILITTNVDEAEVGDAVTVTITLLDESGKVMKNTDITVTINGEDYSAKTNNQGLLVINLIMPTEDLVIEANYAGDTRYAESSGTKTVEFLKSDVIISAENTYGKVGQETIISATLNGNGDLEGKLVKFYLPLGGLLGTATTDEYGVATLTLDSSLALKSGSVDVIISFEGDEYHNAAIDTTISVIIDPADPEELASGQETIPEEI